MSREGGVASEVRCKSVVVIITLVVWGAPVVVLGQAGGRSVVSIYTEVFRS